MRRAGLLAACGLLAVSAFAAGAEYRREDWPHWRGLVSQCWDVRQEVLRRDSLEAPTWDLTTGACRVTAGLWVDPYTAKIAWIKDPAAVDIDHLVPLKWAHEHGGATWPKKRREAFANYLGFRLAIRATDAAVNRSKGARGPSEWAPPNPYARCEYAQAWATLIVIWDLRPGEADRAALQAMAETC